MIAKILDRAADIVQFRGWCRFFLQHPARPHQHCLRGALMEASHELLGVPVHSTRDVEYLEIPVIAVLRERGFNPPVPDYYDPNNYVPVTWNNEHAKDANEVADLLRTAAKRAREEAHVAG